MPGSCWFQFLKMTLCFETWMGETMSWKQNHYHWNRFNLYHGWKFSVEDRSMQSFQRIPYYFRHFFLHVNFHITTIIMTSLSSFWLLLLFVFLYYYYSYHYCQYFFIVTIIGAWLKCRNPDVSFSCIDIHPLQSQVYFQSSCLKMSKLHLPKASLKKKSLATELKFHQPF